MAHLRAGVYQCVTAGDGMVDKYSSGGFKSSCHRLRKRDVNSAEFHLKTNFSVQLHGATALLLFLKIVYLYFSPFVTASTK